MTTPRLPLLHGRALVFAGILLAAFNLRTAVTSLTPLLDRLGETFGFGPTMAGVLGMVPSAAFAVFGVSTPAIARRLGLERTALLAMLLAALGLVGRSLADSTTGLLAGAIVALSGMGIGNVVLPPLVKRYFADRVGTLSALYITALQMGTILPALLAVPLAHAAGWRVSMGGWSLVAVAAAIPWAWLAFVRGRDSAPRSADAGGLAPVAGPQARAGRAWRSPVAWGMALMFGMTSLITYSMFTWLPKLLTEAGATPAFGGTMVALFSALGLFGSLVIPQLAARMRNPFVIVLGSAACCVAAFAGLLWAPMQAPVLWVALLGLGPSTFALSLTLINLRTRTAGGSVALSGFMQGVGYALSCAGPLMFGVLHDVTQAWRWPFAMLLAAVVVLVAGGWLACRPRMLEDSW